MKKIALLVAICTFAFASTGFAALATGVTGTITCGSTNTVDIQLSPKVYAGYKGLDRLGTADFYVAATYHSAGTKVYATASTLTKIWSQEATDPTTEPLSTVYSNVPDTVSGAESETVWSNNGWSN